MIWGGFQTEIAIYGLWLMVCWFATLKADLIFLAGGGIKNGYQRQRTGTTILYRGQK